VATHRREGLGHGIDDVAIERGAAFLLQHLPKPGDGV
jgi:hypothetical protein